MELGAAWVVMVYVRNPLLLPARARPRSRSFSLQLVLPTLLAVAGCAGTSPAPSIPPPALAEPASATTARVAPVPAEESGYVCPVERVASVLSEHANLRYYPEKLTRELSAVAIGEREVSCSIEHVYEECEATPGECAVKGDEARRELGALMLTALGELASDDGLGLLLQLDGRGVYQAGTAAERVLERRMGAAIEGASCQPPSTDEVAATRASLKSFAVIERRGGRWSARAATTSELDDLAYFLTAVASAGPEVGVSADNVSASWVKAKGAKTAADEERDRLFQELSLARKRGDLASVQASASAYLETLGYPETLRAAEEGNYSWGGARYSYVMRDLAFALELGGQHAAAADLYRRANPGGGACGTSDSYRWQQQVEGVIRTSEAAGQCRAVVAERLLDINFDGLHGSTLKPVNESYGLRRLAEAGFDVVRLYRGAVVTRNRELDPETIERILQAAPAKLRDAALARLKTHGAEDWERRVYAAEGLADTGRDGAIPALTNVLASASPALRKRVIKALGQLTARRQIGPCPEDTLSGYGMGGSNIWSRRVHPLGTTCKDQLSDADAGKLARELHRYLGDDDAAVREVTAETLGKLASPTSVGPLKRRLNDPKVTHYTGECHSDFSNPECVPGYGVRDAARESIARIKQLKAEMKQRRAGASG